MISKCYETSSPGLDSKGVELVVDCPIAKHVGGIPDIEELLKETVKQVFPGLEATPVFESNESIGYTHTLHRFRIHVSNSKYIGVRVVVKRREVIRILFTIPKSTSVEVKYNRGIYDPEQDKFINSQGEVKPPPGQVYIDIPIVYAILGVPRIDLSTWSLRVDGLVENPIEIGLPGLYELGLTRIKTDFHCVTGWSVRDLEFTGVPVTRIIDLARPLNEAKWVYIESLDGYSTIIPIEEFTRRENLVALEMNGKPLDILHGYPARLIIPSLYGWKSAKWVKRIHFTNRYIDGYWEALGYHPRGRVDLEERFKNK